MNGEAILNATPVPGQPGFSFATSGTLFVTAPAADNISGSYSLFSYSSTPQPLLSPTGLFIYDNLVSPGSNPIVTSPGLLFFGGLASGVVPEGKGREINFFSNGTNTYDLYTGVNGSYPYSHEFTTSTGGARVVATFTDGPVAAPEPAIWFITASFLLIVLYKRGFRKPIKV